MQKSAVKTQYTDKIIQHIISEKKVIVNTFISQKKQMTASLILSFVN